MAIFPLRTEKVEYDIDIKELSAKDLLTLESVVDTINDKNSRVMSVDPAIDLRVALDPIAGESGRQESWRVTLTLYRNDSPSKVGARHVVNDFEAAANEAFGRELFTERGRKSL